MDQEIIDELCLRLKGPIIALEIMANGRTLPQDLTENALKELLQAKKLLDQLDCNQ